MQLAKLKHLERLVTVECTGMTLSDAAYFLGAASAHGVLKFWWVYSCTACNSRTQLFVVWLLVAHHAPASWQQWTQPAGVVRHHV